MTLNLKVFPVAIVLGVILLVGGGYLLHARYEVKEAIPTCSNPGPGEACPTDYFSFEFRKFQNLRGVVLNYQLHKPVEEFNEKNDQLVGMSIRLGQMQPPGTNWDEKKWKFVPKPPESKPQISTPPTK